jgi:hypothetical protein
MAPRRATTSILAALSLGLFLSGCGRPHPKATSSVTNPLPARRPSALKPQDLPAQHVTATWGDAVQLVAYDVKPLGGDRYRLRFAAKCLKPTALPWAQLTHTTPANPAGLKTEKQRKSGCRIQDFVLVPPTSTWEPGKTYLASFETLLPSAGDPWTLVVGMAALTDGMTGGRSDVIKLTDQGDCTRSPNTEQVILTTIRAPAR